MGVNIKGDNVQIEINVIARPYPDGDNKWDINWLICSIYIKIPGYIADFSTYISCGELRSFYSELKEMHGTLSGKASLQPLESGIFIDASVEKSGHINWIIETQYPEGNGATLNFEFKNEQSYVYQTLRELKEIIEEYPVLEV